MARRALITGIGGHDGSYLADLWLGHGDKVFGTALTSPQTLPTDHLASASSVPASWGRSRRVGLLPSTAVRERRLRDVSRPKS